MPLTEAQRQRRHRKHRAGDHSYCDPARCDGQLNPAPKPIPPTAPPPPKPPRPPRNERPMPGFGPRGQELADAMKDVEMGPAHKVLLVEACRLADRLDRFERTLAGGKWFFERVDEDDRVEIVIDNVLSEARQYASALKQIVAELEPKPVAAFASKPQAIPEKAAGIASLVERLEQRRKSTG